MIAILQEDYSYVCGDTGQPNLGEQAVVLTLNSQKRKNMRCDSIAYRSRVEPQSNTRLGCRRTAEILVDASMRMLETDQINRYRNQSK